MNLKNSLAHALFQFSLIQLIISINPAQSTDPSSCQLLFDSYPELTKKFESLFLASPSNWVTSVNDDETPVSISSLFEFSFCNASSYCPATAVICRLKNGQAAVPDVIGLRSTLTWLKQANGYVLNTTGTNCSVSTTPGQTFKTSVYLRCGKKMGSPRLVHTTDPCNFLFDWETSHACETDAFISKNEIPCSLTTNEYDTVTKSVKKYVTVDFNPLVLVATASASTTTEPFHQVVEFNENIELGVNLCRYETSSYFFKTSF
jgi:hypothetical protein